MIGLNTADVTAAVAAAEYVVPRWGWDPVSLQAVFTGLLVIGIFFARSSVGEARRQRRALDDELLQRMRPWVGLFAFGLSDSQDAIVLQLRNYGPLPARAAQLHVEMRPSGESVRPNPVVWDEAAPKTLVPGEEGNYTVRMAPYPQFSEWRSGRRDVEVSGRLEYELGDRRFQSTFAATLWFSEDPSAPGAPVRNNWRNVSAD